MTRTIRELGGNSLRTSLALGLCALASCTPSTSVEPSAVLITLDTTRADAIGCYGEDPEGSVTPELDQLAQEGVLFLNAHTAAPITLPAHASMLTGLYPLRHGVRDNALWTLPEQALTLAEHAAANGIQTAAFVSSIVLDRSYGLVQGFEHYEQPERQALRTTSHAVELNGRATVIRAIDWLRTRDRSRPMLLWVHLFDPHGPYQPPKRLSKGVYARNRGYYGEVAFMDEQIGRLVRALDEFGELEHTTLLIVADHGEAFGEHGEISHGTYTFETTLRVPMILRLANKERAGQVSNQIVSVVDVFPTLVDALNLPEVSGLDGLSLLRRQVPAERGVYFESLQGFLSFNWSPLTGWLDSSGKYIHGAHPRFFTSPAEDLDRSESAAEQVQMHVEALNALAALPRLKIESLADSDDELLDGIRALGYTSVAGERDSLPEPTAASVLPDPMERIDEYNQCLVALELANEARYTEAISVLEKILEVSPSNFFALDRLGFALVADQQFAAAIAPLERMVAFGPEWSHTLLNLGIAKLETDDLVGSSNAFRAALKLDADIAGDIDAYLQRLRQSKRDELADRLETELAH